MSDDKIEEKLEEFNGDIEGNKGLYVSKKVEKKKINKQKIN